MSVLLGVCVNHVLNYSLSYLFEGRSKCVASVAHSYIHAIFLAFFYS